MIEQKNLNLEKKRSCLRFQILKARVRKGCFCSSLYIFSIGNCMTSLVLTIMAGRGERGATFQNYSFNYHLLCVRSLFPALPKRPCPGPLQAVQIQNVHWEIYVVPLSATLPFSLSSSPSSYKIDTKPWCFSQGPIIANFYCFDLPFWPISVSSPAQTN